MARPIKEGLDYFPLDTHFDEKIQALESVFKNDGLVWIIKFWQAAYRTNEGDVSFNSYQGVIHAENSRVTTEKQNEIIKLCVEIGLLVKLDNERYTSNGIKKRLERIVEERRKWRIEHKSPIAKGVKGVIHADNCKVTGEIEIEKEIETKIKKEPKTKFLDGVFLTNKEFEHLCADFGEAGANERIKNLDFYIGSKGDKYKSHYKTILMWEHKNKKESTIQGGSACKILN